ncbi:hypothetical protein DAPPUDRAFT_107409 [Daphnia pulex]|uniref:Uncharacterized protein n=1 Tax=Daphnia pulex TaxID=6669 RepID=E9GX04_DAPPU|nr:hypothetical protein DAPPUDRAFT_107409 [Daphnia pulex]|eukprot:EFX76020.1 hypothetical protein DAPPUDRAFT_107409 [Daphnia pulex]
MAGDSRNLLQTLLDLNYLHRKPAYEYETEDIDWVPTKNLKTKPDNVPSSLNSSVLSTDVTGSFQSRNEEVSTSTAGCFTFAADSLTGYSTWPYGGDSLDQAKSAASFGYPPPWCALVN